MLYPNVFTILLTLLLLPQVFVNGGIVRELSRKFLHFFKSSKPKRPGPFYDNCNLCTFGPCTPIVWPSSDGSFDGSEDAKKIGVAFEPRTLDDNNKAIVANILTDRSAPQRAAIADAYAKVNRYPLIDQLPNKVSVTYRYYMFIQQMVVPLPQSISTTFDHAIRLLKQTQYYKEQGHATIVEMLTTLPKCLLDKVNKASSPSNNLMTRIDTALVKDGKPPEYRALIKKLAELERDTDQRVYWIKALTNAYELKSAVIARRETEMKEIFLNLFTKYSIPQSIETLVVYENLRHGDRDFKSLSDDIDKYPGGEKEIYKIMARLFTNKPLYYAKVFEYILKSGNLSGFDTDRLFVYMFVGRYDIDLKNIIDAYNKLSKTGLKADFSSWNDQEYGKEFQPIFENILDKASRIS